MYSEEGEVIAGKDEYLSPEQARCEVTDSRADLFSCAIVLAEMLLCKNIFEATSEIETRKNILELSIPDFTEMRRDLDPRLDDILQRAFKRDREKRFKSAQHMLTSLEMFLYGEGYGPTNEKLAYYVSDLLGKTGDTAATRWASGTTPRLNTARRGVRRAAHIAQ